MALPAPRRTSDGEPLPEVPTVAEGVRGRREKMGRVLAFPGNGEDGETTRIQERPQDDFKMGQITIHKPRHPGSETKRFVDACIRTKEAIRRMLDLKQIPDAAYTITFYDNAFVPEEGPLAFPGIPIRVYDPPEAIRRFINQHCAEAIRLQAKQQPDEAARHPQASGKRRAA